MAAKHTNKPVVKPNKTPLGTYCTYAFVGLLGLFLAIIGTYYIIKPTTKNPLCVVCGELPIEKSKVFYVAKKNEAPPKNRSLDNTAARKYAKPAWLCENCGPPPRISEDLPIIHGAYSHIETKPQEGRTCALIASGLFGYVIVIVSVVICFDTWAKRRKELRRQGDQL